MNNHKFSGLLHKENESRLNIYELIFCLICFAYFLLWIFKPFNYGPDEYMRYEVSTFFVKNNRLPVGKEAIDSIWGFSYAHLPTMLCNVLDYIPMKLASLLSGGNTRVILLSARAVSSLAGALTVYFSLKTSKLIFTSPARYIMPVFIASLPQFAFLASYVNNDILALLGISIILYSWVLALKFNWNYKYAFLLCVGMSICALSYYNGYAWILSSIFFFFFTFISQNKKDTKSLVKMTVFIVGFTALFTGYFFFRHLYLYKDLFGLNTTTKYCKLYGHPDIQPENRQTPSNLGTSLFGMLIGMGWIKITYKSFIGAFGYMQFYMPKRVYVLFAVFFAVCLIGLILKIVCDIKNKKHCKKQEAVLYICIIASAVITVLLSIYNSYFFDYQPQGRYCFPIVSALAVFVTMGAEKLLSKFKNTKLKYAAAGFVCAVLMITSVEMYITVLLPS